MKASARKRRGWFEDSLFNMLVDYYPEIPFRPYGSGATPENVLPVLRDLRLGCLIVYAKGHSGTTAFPSALKTEHPMLSRDMPEAFRRYTRETDTRLFLYYSGQLDGIAGTRHPEWRMRGKDGQDLQFFKEFETFTCYCNCPLSGYFDEWVSVHLREMIERYDPDGIWVDGDWAGPCYCPRCAERFRQETGMAGPMPDFNLKTPEGVAWTRVWGGIMHEWRSRFRALVKSLKPDCMYSAGNVSARREYGSAFDWRSGDWFSPNNHRLHMSIVARRYATTGIPYDAYTCDTSFVHSRPNMRSRTKTLPRMLQEGATLLANGAQWGYWTYPNGDGALIPSRMRMARRAAESARARRDICLHTDFVPETAVLNPQPGVYIWSECHGPLAGAGKALIALHRSPVFMDETSLEGRLPYDLIVLPEAQVVPASAVKRLARYVRSGGRLLTVGDAPVNSPELQDLLGIRLGRRAALNDGHVMRMDAEFTGVAQNWDRWDLAGAEELYPLYLSWDQFNPEAGKIRGNWPMHGQVDEQKPEPAGMPAATIRRVGRGVAVHVATNLFSQYWAYGYPEQLAWVREILDFLTPHPLVRTDAPQCVEIALRQRNDTLLAHLINGNPGRDISLVGSEDWWVDSIPPLGPIHLTLRCAAKPRQVTWEPGGRMLRTSWKKPDLRITIPRLEIHGCVAVKGWRRA